MVLAYIRRQQNPSWWAHFETGTSTCLWFSDVVRVRREGCPLPQISDHRLRMAGTWRYSYGCDRKCPYGERWVKGAGHLSAWEEF